MKSVEKWYNDEFEKLGWVVLSKYERKISKITQYKINIDGLIKTLEGLLLIYQDPDKKRDLIVMLNNTKLLKDFVDKKLKIT